MLTTFRRRAWLLAGLGLAAVLGACALPPAAEPPPPIVFVHGNGDSAALWTTTLWRFESQGWPRERLHAIDLPYPLARDADDKPQPGRSSTEDHRRFLAAEVERVLAGTGARQVVLFANSRGGNAVRNYIAQGGAAKVSHAILGGTPNHGVWSNPGFRPSNEFNGAGPFLSALNNQGAAGVEVTPGPQWMTIRSDHNDKFAQPDGVWIGAKGTPTNVGFDGPELKGAHNVVIPGIDHRETSFGLQAFAAAYGFITGRAPTSTAIAPESRIVLDGKVSGLGLGNDPMQGRFATNLPLAGATVAVFATDAASGERLGPPKHRRRVGSDGRWGPFTAQAGMAYEFQISAPGYATTHVYRSPFPRSSALVNLRAEMLADADREAGSVLSFVRPRGYFGLPRDRIVFDGQDPAPGISPGVAGVAVSRLKLAAGPMRPVAAEFNGERIVGRNWPAAQNHVVFLELQQ
jgi:pimeloyl-ACP methyl ester carboxylesterase